MFCHGERVRATAAVGLGSADRECSGTRAGPYTGRKGYRAPCRIPFASRARSNTNAHSARCLRARNTTMIFANDHKTVCCTPAVMAVDGNTRASVRSSVAVAVTAAGVARVTTLIFPSSVPGFASRAKLLSENSRGCPDVIVVN